MSGLVIVFLILGVVLFIAFALWFFMVRKDEMTRWQVLVCDSVLIVLSVAVLIVGLQLRNNVVEANRAANAKALSIEGFEVEGDAAVPADPNATTPAAPADPNAAATPAAPADPNAAAPAAPADPNAAATPVAPADTNAAATPAAPADPNAAAPAAPANTSAVPVPGMP